ncbi:FkbM family methyltransferase [Phenylobacterium sp.]|jgi:FkbM family methyltransferase|uniref:FkbM family methyltransferase n=1 Tax=Phenylobacterium sp. TaxID=1871053 RepID=UPI002F93A870
MRPSVVQALRFQGYAPRTLLDVGAHVGDFTRGFLEHFPDCRPTLVEPNPHCRPALELMPFERHEVAAFHEAGRQQFFLSKQWLQSTGSSLYREKSDYFRDELVEMHEVETVRLDDLFEGRRFDFVKIDVQGAELDVLRGGEAVLRQADYILLEIPVVDFNERAPEAETIFAQLHRMGFHCTEVMEVHRLPDVNANGILQMDFLFERNVKRPSQSYAYGPLHGHDELLEWLRQQKAKCPDFTVIDVGAAANPWSAEVLDATFDMSECGVAPLHFRGNLNDSRSFDEVLRHVARHGRFSYCICSHTLEDLAYPAMALEMLPRIAEAGYIAVPSRYLESLRPEGPYRGFIHHRWVLDTLGDELILAPKLPFLEHLSLGEEGGWTAQPDRFEFQMTWRGAINFKALNGDYMGPTMGDVVDMYGRFLDRP